MVAYFRSTGDMVWRRYNRNKRQTLEEDLELEEDDNRKKRQTLEEELELEEEEMEDEDKDSNGRQSRSVDPRYPCQTLCKPNLVLLILHFTLHYLF